MARILALAAAVALIAVACSSSETTPTGHDTPERAVVAWFEAIDAGDATTASESIHPDSLALILGIENALPVDVTAQYLTDGVPLELQVGYWRSFAEGFADFASRPVSTLTFGKATPFTSEGIEFASVPISSGPATESVVIARMREDGSWEVDMVASLGDGFANLLLAAFENLPEGTDADIVRAAFNDTVVPSLWAAMADGSFGEDFARSALAVIDTVTSVNSSTEG
jgi:hypothetical protein